MQQRGGTLIPEKSRLQRTGSATQPSSPLQGLRGGALRAGRAAQHERRLGWAARHLFQRPALQPRQARPLAAAAVHVPSNWASWRLRGRVWAAGGLHGASGWGAHGACAAGVRARHGRDSKHHVVPTPSPASRSPAQRSSHQLLRQLRGGRAVGLPPPRLARRRRPRLLGCISRQRRAGLGGSTGRAALAPACGCLLGLLGAQPRQRAFVGQPRRLALEAVALAVARVAEAGAARGHAAEAGAGVGAAHAAAGGLRAAGGAANAGSGRVGEAVATAATAEEKARASPRPAWARSSQ